MKKRCCALSESAEKDAAVFNLLEVRNLFVSWPWKSDPRNRSNDFFFLSFLWSSEQSLGIETGVEMVIRPEEYA